MTQRRAILWFAMLTATLLLLPGKTSAQSATVTDDAFLSSYSTTQQLNLNGQGIVLIVAGSSATVGNSNVGATKAYIKFQLQSSLPPGTTAANVTKATLKLFISPSCNPTGAIDIYPITSVWTESTLNPSSPPTYDSTPINSAPIVVGKADTFMVIDLTELVQDWLESSTTSGSFQNNGIVLVANTSATNVIFDSKESFVTSHEPRLEIVLANSGPQGPAGPQGPQGATGATGSAGAAATVTVGATTTGLPGTTALVTNAGSSSAALLNFLIPQGPTGAQGPQGPQGQQGPMGQIGPQGIQGPQGTPGVPGIPGLPGQTGSTGAAGPAGTNGLGFNFRKAFDPAAAYALNDVVSYNGSSYVGLAATKPGDPTPDQNPAWSLVAQQGATGLQGQAGAQGPQGPQGPQGLTGQIGPPGVQGLQGTQGVPGIPGPIGQTGAAGVQGPAGTNGLGFNFRKAFDPAAAYALNDVVSYNGSSYVALAATKPGDPTPDQNPAWSLVAQQGATGPQGQAGAQGPQGIQGIMGLPGLPGPPGQSPVGAALTTTSNTFAGNQTINGNLILGSGGSVQFADGTVQTSASTAGGAGIPSGYMITGTTPIAPPGYTLSGAFKVGDQWTSIAPMPTARLLLAAAAVNGKIYAIGGLNATSVSTVEVYDASSNSWSTAASMPTARHSPAAAEVNGKIYAIGGRTTNGLVNLNTVEVYDPNSNSWSTAASMPTARTGLATATYNGKIYAIGGKDASFNVLSTVEVYDPKANSWSTAVSMPTARSFLAAAAVNGKIYTIGGSTINRLNTVEVYDPATNTWSTAASMPTARDGLATAAVNGKIYAIGGEDASINVLSTVEVYDPSSNSWSAAASMPTARGELAAADANGLIYAVGGTNSLVRGTALNATEQYSPPVTIYTFLKN